MKSFLNEFKEFAMRGNVLDLAIGVVIGDAFTAIVNSLVNDIIMPIFSLLTGSIHFGELALVLNPVEGGGITWNYDNFLQVVLNFIVISFCIFCTINAINRFNKKEEKKEEEAPVVSDETKALQEIIEILKNKWCFI